MRLPELFSGVLYCTVLLVFNPLENVCQTVKNTLMQVYGLIVFVKYCQQA